MAAARDSGPRFDAALSENQERKTRPQAFERLGKRPSSMSVKGQLTASRDFLMAGMRASPRGAKPNEQAEKLVRACPDLVDHLARQSENATAGERQESAPRVEHHPPGAG